MEKILVEVSARHVHLTQEVIDAVFGEGHQLTPKKYLSQPGLYAAEEKVTVVGPKGSFKMSVLGPARKYNQIEISQTDTRTLGVEAPLRESGFVDGSAPCKIIGPCGEVELNEGVIVIKRHIHMSTDDAKNYNVEDGEVVCVKIKTIGRSLIFDDVVIRVSKDYALAMHLDTDEANAAMIKGSAYGTLIKHAD